MIPNTDKESLDARKWYCVTEIRKAKLRIIKDNKYINEMAEKLDILNRLERGIKW